MRSTRTAIIPCPPFTTMTTTWSISALVIQTTSILRTGNLLFELRGIITDVGLWQHFHIDIERSLSSTKRCLHLEQALFLIFISVHVASPTQYVFVLLMFDSCFVRKCIRCKYTIMWYYQTTDIQCLPRLLKFYGSIFIHLLYYIPYIDNFPVCSLTKIKGCIQN